VSVVLKSAADDHGLITEVHDESDRKNTVEMNHRCNYKIIYRKISP